MFSYILSPNIYGSSELPDLISLGLTMR